MPRRPKCHGLPANGQEMGRPLPKRRPDRIGRSQLASTHQPNPNTTRTGTPDRGPTLAATARPDAARRPPRTTRIDGACGASALPDQPVIRDRPCHRRALAPLRTRIPRFTDPRRHHQVRKHPRRRRTPFLDRKQSKLNDRATAHRTGERGNNYRPRIGTAYVHIVIDDHSRVAYAEICADEKTATAIGLLHRATAWFATRGVTVERVLSDNGSCYRSYAWRNACTELGIKPKRTRPYRPQTNGEIGRFHRTLANDWAYARFYTSTAQRDQVLPDWLHFHNHHRAHSALGGQPPITRRTNLPERYT